MKLVFAVLFVASCAVVINGQFSKTLDNLNVDMILKNDRILTNYVKCLLDKGEAISQMTQLIAQCLNKCLSFKVRAQAKDVN